MKIPGLTLIGESINDSIPSTHALLERGDMEGIQALARRQDEGGADYIDINVGARTPDFMGEVVRAVQRVTAKPLSIDSPDAALCEAGLRVYEAGRAGGACPILNSISPLRTKMFALERLQRFRPILMASERAVGGEGISNHTAEEVLATVHELVARAARHRIPVTDCIVDPAIAPIGADGDGQFRRLMGALQLMCADKALEGIHASVGLSNFTVMLPPKRADGASTKTMLESAFLTMAMPLGLNHVIGSTRRQYRILPPDDPACVCLRECLTLEGFDVILRIQDYYS